jgi:hypothetical protein
MTGLACIMHNDSKCSLLRSKHIPRLLSAHFPNYALDFRLFQIKHYTACAARLQHTQRAKHQARPQVRAATVRIRKRPHTGGKRKRKRGSYSCSTSLFAARQLSGPHLQHPVLYFHAVQARAHSPILIHARVRECHVRSASGLGVERTYSASHPPSP